PSGCRGGRERRAEEGAIAAAQHLVEELAGSANGGLGYRRVPPGFQSGACFAGSHSPFAPPLAPPAPLPSRRRYSSASQLLWHSPTSRDRASSATANFAAGRSSSDRKKRSRPIRAFSATPHDGQRPCRMLAEDPGTTQPRAAYLQRCSSNASGLHG